MSINVMAQTSSTIAAVLANPPTLSDEEQLFHEALDQVKRDKVQVGTLPPFFNSFVTAKDANDVKYLIETKCGENGIWREQDGGTKLRKLEKLSTCILEYKGLADSLVAIST